MASDRITDKRTVLHVGCGPRDASPLLAEFHSAEWSEIRLDIDPAAEPDIVASITDLAMIATESMDAVYSSHNLEHLHTHEVPVALGEFWRVLKPGGFAIIRVPDLQQVAVEVARGNLDGVLYQSPAGPIAALDVLFGWRKRVQQGHTSWSHKTGFVQKLLGERLVRAGFRRVQVGRRPAAYELVARAEKQGASPAGAHPCPCPSTLSVVQEPE